MKLNLLLFLSANSPFPSLRCCYEMNTTPRCNAKVHKKLSALVFTPSNIVNNGNSQLEIYYALFLISVFFLYDII